MLNRRLFQSAVFAALAVVLCLSTSARAQSNYQWSTVAHATPDECFLGNANTGLTPEQAAANVQSFNTHYPVGLSATDITNCKTGGGLPKINQAYVWGLTTVGRNLWLSTVANTLCLVLDTYYGTVPDPHQNGSWVCDKNNGEDFKPPRVFVYNADTASLTDLTQKILDKSPTDAGRLKVTFGLRSAGNYGGVVFFGGLVTGATKSSVVMYAFNAETQDYLGSYLFDGSDASHPYYNNIRQWHVISNQLFTGVAKPGGGTMLRWTGSVGNPFSFVVVGNIAGDPAYFVEHKGNIYVSTWGAGGLTTGMSIYMSPSLHGDLGLDDTDAGSWTEVWNLNRYEVEPTAVQGGGAIASYGGYLYWGTMYVPSTGYVAFKKMYPTAPTDSNTYLNTSRSIAIFRSEGFAPAQYPAPYVRLLYGTSQLPKFDGTTWSKVRNNLDQDPLYGGSGFGNVFNNYTWTMEVFNGKLYVGTMDWSFQATDGDESTSLPPTTKAQAAANYGADLWVFENTTSPAVSVHSHGMGNQTSYGIRTMAADSETLWLGMANPMNLRSDPDNNPGGWKLIALSTPPDMTWSNPADITYGTPLGSSQLNATATVPGSFVYTPGAGTVLNAGASQTLTATFTATNTGFQWPKTVTINVSKAGTISTVNASAANVLAQDSVTFTAHVVPSTFGTPTGNVAFMDGTTSLGTSGLDAGGNATLSIATLTAGSHSITAVYAGDTNFLTSTSSAATTTVQDFQFTTTGGVLSSTINNNGVATFSFTLSPQGGATFLRGVTLSLTGAPAGASVVINPTTIAAGGGAQTVTVSVQPQPTKAMNRAATSGLMVFAIALMPLGLVSFRKRSRLKLVLLVLIAAAIIAGTSCGGSGSSNVAPQNYSMTVTAASGSLQHTLNLNLTVQ